MNAILYARFSPRPDEEKCESADKQIERCRDWCKAMNHTIVCDPFKDEAISGASMEDREGLKAAMQRTRLEKGILVVTALDRLGRNTIDILSISEELTSAGACWASLTQNIDTSTPTGRFMVTIFAGLAQMEREQIGIRTSAGMNRLQEAGWCMSARPKTGRRIAPPETQPTPHERETTRGIPPKALTTVEAPDEIEALARAKELRDMRYSWRAIADTLNQEGRLYRGTNWKHVTIYRLLRDDDRAAT